MHEIRTFVFRSLALATAGSALNELLHESTAFRLTLSRRRDSETPRLPSPSHSFPASLAEGVRELKCIEYMFDFGVCVAFSKVRPNQKLVTEDRSQDSCTIVVEAAVPDSFK